MSNNFVLSYGAPFKPAPSNYAPYDLIPTTLVDAAAFEAASSTSIILDGVVPDEFTGSGTLKVDLVGCANTTTAADIARWDIATEFKTPDAGEGLDSANLDGTPDSADMSFSTTAYDGEKITISLTPAVTPVAGDRFRIQITRDHDHANDDLASAAFLTDAIFREEA